MSQQSDTLVHRARQVNKDQINSAKLSNGTLESWIPEPLVPELDEEAPKPHVITSKPGKIITIDGRDCLNFATHNYLGLADDPRLVEASIGATRKYGVGACGPRAFYGTMDVHLKLEEELANFLDVQEAVLYSFYFSTVASAIPAYAKATDIIFVDEYCNFAIQQGMVASKSQIIKFKHNDVSDLEQKIEELHDIQRKKHGKVLNVRTFLIVEGIYVKTGDICPLKELIEVKKKHKIRLFIDESRSFGILGKDGKGVTQHFGVDINDVDLIMASLENALCSFGGFCAGSTFVIDHQRLAGAGYCFSASLPPLQVQTALTALNIIKDEPTIIKKANELCSYAHDRFKRLVHLKDISHPLSPLKILTLRGRREGHDSPGYSQEDERLLDNICVRALDEDKIALTIARHLEDEEMTSPISSIRVVISVCLSHDDIDKLVDILNKHSAVHFT